MSAAAPSSIVPAVKAVPVPSLMPSKPVRQLPRRPIGHANGLDMRMQVNVHLRNDWSHLRVLKAYFLVAVLPLFTGLKSAV